MNYVTYNDTTGNITAIAAYDYDLSKEALDRIFEDASYVVEESDVDAFEHYVDVTTKTVSKRAVLTENTTVEVPADGKAHTVLRSLPKLTQVAWFDGEQDTINDGVLEFGTDLAGTYTVTVVAPRYKETRITIQATEVTE